MATSLRFPSLALLLALFVNPLTACSDSTAETIDTNAATAPGPGASDKREESEQDPPKEDEPEPETDPDPQVEPDEPAPEACSECEGPVCLVSVSGKLLFSDGKPCAHCDVQVCTRLCIPAVTDEDGVFTRDISKTCSRLDWAAGDHLYFSINDEQYRDTHALYSAEYSPEQTEIDENFNFDTGVHYLYPFPDTGVMYDGTSEVEVTGDGLSLSVKAGELKATPEEPIELKVMRFPLDEWVPPFIKEPASLQHLYVMAPYFEKFEDPSQIANPHFVTLSVDASKVAWSATDAGSVWMLGDYNRGFLYCENDVDEHIAQGAFSPCRPATFNNGRVEASVPVLGWMRFVKNP